MCLTKRNPIKMSGIAGIFPANIFPARELTGRARPSAPGPQEPHAAFYHQLRLGITRHDIQPAAFDFPESPLCDFDADPATAQKHNM
jgi:hypothetical protein